MLSKSYSPVIDAVVFHENDQNNIPEFQLNSSEEPLDKYLIQECIGHGTFSIVYKAINNENSQNVAVKVIDAENLDIDEFDTVAHEASLLHRIQHPNIIEILDSFATNQKIYLVMPFMERGSLRSIIEKFHPKGIADESLIATILKYVLLGLQYCHHNCLIHRDIKPDNILVSNDGNIVLGDFGTTCELLQCGTRRKFRTTLIGTPCFMAPEMFQHDQDEGYDQQVDIWAFGITALFLAEGKTPYDTFSPIKVMLEVVNSKHAPKLSDANQWSSNFHDMIKKCLQKESNDRIHVDALLKHNFFKQAHNVEYIKNHL